MISIIIPVYNAENKLPSMINCLLNQLYHNFEVVLVDDGSSDGSADICDNIVNNDNRFRVLHQKNAGVSIARNNGMKMAKGEYIAFLDADDEIPNNYLDTMIQTLEHTKVDIVVCDVVIINDNIELARFTYEDSVLNRNQAISLLLSRKNINSGPYAKLFRADVLNRLSFPHLKVYEDILFIKDAFCHSNTIAITNKTEYRYIQNTEGAMQMFIKSPFLDVITATKELVEFIEKNKELSPECMYITISHLFQYVQSLNGFNDDNAKEFVKQARILYRKHVGSILKCKAFPIKEKLVYMAFILGWSYEKGRFVRYD